MAQKMGLFVLKTSDADEKKTALLPLLDIAAVLVMCHGRILMGFNAQWGAFTLPMSKRRSWEDATTAKGKVREEKWEDTATRAAAEWLGRTLVVTPDPLGEIGEFQQSDRDGKWKRYHLRAYRLEVDPDIQPRASAPTEWLLPAQILDTARGPISPTARHIVAELRAKGMC